MCAMKLFIHARVTLEYFNFKRENEFERFVVYFHCFSDNCGRVTAGGNVRARSISECIPTSSAC